MEGNGRRERRNGWSEFIRSGSGCGGVEGGVSLLG